MIDRILHVGKDVSFFIYCMTSINNIHSKSMQFLKDLFFCFMCIDVLTVCLSPATHNVYLIYS